MAKSNVPFWRRLSVRQAQVAVALALFIGIVFAVIQILLDAREERQGLRLHADSILDYAQLTAARAAYRLDTVAAQELAQSLLGDPAVVRVEIFDDFGDPLATVWRGVAADHSQIASLLLGSETVSFVRTLRIQEPATTVGRLLIELDPVAAAPGFHQRTLNALFSGIAKSTLLSVLLLVFYQFMVTKRIARLAESVTLDGQSPDTPHQGDELDHLDHQMQQWAEKLKSAAERAETANNAKSVFLACMSHEMRTPLNAIIGYAEIMELGIGIDNEERRRSYLENIAKGGRQLNKLLGDILDFSRIEAGSIDLDLEFTRPADLIRSNLGQIRELVRQEGLTMDVSLESDAVIRVDRSRLRQILLNLVSNAVKYNKPGGTVELGCRVAGNGMLRCFVHDTGIGIPPDKLAGLFDEFVRGEHHHSDIPGAGLGLSICRVLTEGMGGRIGCESAPGEGSTFWVEFPIEAADHDVLVAE